MRATFITTTPRSSLEALRYQGIAVSESHAQLQSMLQNNLSPEHARFFAEPVLNSAGDSVDWYTPLEGDIVRLDSLPPEAQQTAVREIRRLAGEIDALAESLKQSGEGPKSIRGNILALALRYPGPEYIYMVGDQPVLLGWGFSAASSVAGPQDLMRLGAAAPLAAAPPLPPGSEAVPPVPPPPSTGFGWLRAILALLFGLLLCLALLFLAGLLLGTSGCPVAGLPWTNGTLGCAPAPSAPEPKKTAGPTPEEISALTAEQEKERSLRRELDGLRAQLGDRLASCPRPKKEEPKPEPVVPEPPAPEPVAPEPPLRAEAPPPPEEPAEPPILGDIMPTTPEPPAEPVKPVEPPKQPKPQKPAEKPKAEKPQRPAEPPKLPKSNKVASGDTLEIPDDARKNNDLSFLEGCWYCETGLVNAATGEPITVLYCFDDKGGGSRTIQEKRTGRTCRGGVTAQFDSSGKLSMRGGPAQCSPGRPFVGQTVECQQQGKKAECFGKEDISRRSNRWRATFRRK